MLSQLQPLYIITHRRSRLFNQLCNRTQRQAHFQILLNVCFVFIERITLIQRPIWPTQRQTFGLSGRQGFFCALADKFALNLCRQSKNSGRDFRLHRAIKDHFLLGHIHIHFFACESAQNLKSLKG